MPDERRNETRERSSLLNHIPRRVSRGPWPPVVAFFALVLVMTGARIHQERMMRPSPSERIAATLVSWGLAPDGFSPPVSDEEIAERRRRLRSDDGEERVRAARWLADRGVREAGEAIAASMTDAATLRPCQLAHSLGHLGDPRWSDELIAAARQTGNTDLRVCAVIALRELASEGTIDALIELSSDPVTGLIAVEALGEIGDSRALPTLRSLHATTDDTFIRNQAARAMSRIETLQSDDPIDELIERVELSVVEGSLDRWAVRILAQSGDARAVAALSAVMESARLSIRKRETVAAALLALRPAGVAALESLMDREEIAATTAGHALALLPGLTPEKAFASRSAFMNDDEQAGGRD